MGISSRFHLIAIGWRCTLLHCVSIEQNTFVIRQLTLHITPINTRNNGNVFLHYKCQ